LVIRGTPHQQETTSHWTVDLSAFDPENPLTDSILPMQAHPREGLACISGLSDGGTEVGANFL
jgi:hypothetical protein